MKYKILHDIRGRMRVHIVQKQKMTDQQADALAIYFKGQKGVTNTKVYERTGDMVFNYVCSKQSFLNLLDSTDLGALSQYENVTENSIRSINRHYQERVAHRIMLRLTTRYLLPVPVRTVITIVRSARYFVKAIKTLLKKKAETALLDAAALAASFIRSDYDSAGFVVFLLDIGRILEDWLEKKKIESLSETMSLNVDYVWLYTEDGEVRVRAEKVHNGDILLVNEGEMIPFDGIVRAGQGVVLQSGMTGNAMPQPKMYGDSIFAGTLLEEGALVMEVQEEDNLSRYDKLIMLVDRSQNLMPEYEIKAIQSADKFVPYLMGGTALTYFLTRNLDRAFSFLMVDFSYALKLALPLAVLRARDAAQKEKMIVKGGKFLQNMAEADVIMFDKTGTLTKAEPVLRAVHSYGNYDEIELIRMAACLEEHVSNGVSRAIVRAAQGCGLEHEEMHGEVKNVKAHGIATKIQGKEALIGSFHFIFEDEKCQIPDGLMEELSYGGSGKEHQLFLAIDKKLEGIFYIEDVLRDEAADVIRKLRESGFKKVIMLTGDAEFSAKDAASEAGIGTYMSEQLPTEKADYIKEWQERGHKVVMVGDGINDSLALSIADVGIAVSAGAAVTKELADVVIENDQLYSIVALKKISQNMMKHLEGRYNMITRANGALIALAATGMITPATLSTVSNITTVYAALENQKSSRCLESNNKE